MPAPQHIRITWSGILGSDALAPEIWSNNMAMRLGGATIITQADLQTLANAAMTRYKTLVGIVCTTQVKLLKARAAVVGDDGHVLRNGSGAYIQADSVGVAERGGSAVAVPFQIALSATLHTAFAGPTGRGRIYLPCPAGDPTVEGKVPLAGVNAAVGQVDAMITGLNTDAAALASAPYACVASSGSLVKGLAPALHRVTSVSVGDVYDTQRRRRNNLVEVRQTQPI